MIAKKDAAKRVAAKPALLSGGNPQVPKAYGDAHVQAYIAAMPGWKRDVGRRLDALIARTVPGVRKSAVRRCVHSPPERPSRRTCAISISTTTSSTKLSSPPGVEQAAALPGERM